MSALRSELPRDHVGDFKSAMAAAGLPVPADVLGDGKLHRFPTNGKAGDESGWYVLHLDGLPAGEFGDWRSDARETWRADIGRRLTAHESAAQRARIAEVRRVAEAERARAHESAAQKAVALWESAVPATTDHPYLRRKGVRPHVARVLTTGVAGWLAVPMRDTEGKLWNLERIAPEKPSDGGPDKKGLFQARRLGLFCLIGDFAGVARVLVCEGFATGASLHEATGATVAVAFNAGNLEPVARAIRAARPEVEVLVCADDDWQTAGNPGMKAAEAAAAAVGARVAVPAFAGERVAGWTDFNDLAVAEGLDAVARIIDPPPASRPATDAEPSPFPPPAERPAFVVLDDWVEYEGRRYRPGVHYCYVSAETKSNPAAPVEMWVTGPLHIDAQTFDATGHNFGRLLRWRDTRGVWRTWAMPMELLRGAGDELRGALLSMGLDLDPDRARRYLPKYLQHRVPSQSVRCVGQTGWEPGGCFVLPDAVVGAGADGVVFQSLEQGAGGFAQAGSLEGWRAQVAARAVGNPLLTLAVSSAVAGPLLAKCGMDGGGLHFVEDSSTGKTTLIAAACSVWGGAAYKRSWRATANGLEGAALLCNDGLLALDEISECDGREVGAIVYAVSNGQGKARASRSGLARPIARWRCFLLSSGERTLATAMAEGGKVAKAGQSVRLLDVPAGRAFGVFDNLHGEPTGAAFADSIRAAALAQYGTAGRAFLERLARDERDFRALLDEVRSLPAFAVGDAGQERRAASRFALVALAGELATEYGLTGWAEGAATEAAADGLRAWMSLRVGGQDERRQVVDAVSAFIERHGDGRFSSIIGDAGLVLRDRAGWWRSEDEDQRCYLFTADGLREALRGHDFHRALETLGCLGALPAKDSEGKRSRVTRVAGRTPRLYPIDPRRLLS